MARTKYIVKKRIVWEDCRLAQTGKVERKGSKETSRGKEVSAFRGRSKRWKTKSHHLQPGMKALLEIPEVYQPPDSKMTILQSGQGVIEGGEVMDEDPGLSSPGTTGGS